MGRSKREIGPLTTSVAAELRAERARLGMTLEQLAERAEVPYSTLGKILQAQTSIDVNQLHAVSTALGLSMREVVERAEAALAASEPAEVIDIRGRKASEPTPSVDHLKGQPRAAAPKRRDTGEGDDHA
jgi:transcriptional regulator with XRE-family HTH domain